MSSKNLVITFLFLFCIPFSAFTQGGFEFGLGAGGYAYSGDITAVPKILNIRPGGEIFLRYNFNAMLAARLNVTAGSLYANDKDTPDLYKQMRGVEFRADFVGVDLRAEYNFRDFRAKSDFSRTCPYVYLGAAYTKFSNRGTYRVNTLDSPEINMPFGIGVRYAMSYNWNLGFEIGSRLMFTDDLDTIKELEQLSKFQMGNPFTKDAYHYIGISLSYTFEGVYCPIRF